MIMNYLSHSGPKVRHGPFSLTMRILITGGFGFIGGRLATYLSLAGHQVVLGSRNETHLPNWLPQAEVVKIKWSDESALESSCEGVDVIIHAAGMNAQDCAADPLGALDFNGVTTKRLVEAANRVGVKKFIYLSTAHVYASPLVGTITEKTLPSNSHPYASSHLAGESAVLNANERGVIQGVVIRLSNTYGAPMHKDVNCWMLVVNDLCRQAAQTRRLVLQTSGLQQRDFVCMTEVCRVAEALIIADGGSVKNSIFNVGSGVSQSILEIATLIQQRCSIVLGFEPFLDFKQADADEEQPRLSYMSDHLASAGISVKSMDKVIEIDELLQFCQRAFPKEESINI